MVTKLGQEVSFAPRNATLGYQVWYNWENLTKTGAVATCGQWTTNINSTLPIAGKNGTYNRPGYLKITKFGFDLPNGTVVEKVIVHYAQQKTTLSSSKGIPTYPIFNGATFTLLNTGKTAVGVPVPIEYTHSTIEFTGVTIDQINDENFGIMIEYPKNSATNPGTIALGDVSIEIITRNPNITVSSSTPNSKIVLGSYFNVEFDVTRLEKIAYTPSCEIEFSGVSYVKKVSGVGTITKNTTDNTYLWVSYFTNSNSNKMTLQFKASTVGTHKITITDTSSNKKYTLVLTVVNYTTTVTTTLNGNKPLMINEEVDYSIDIKTNNPELTKQTITVQLPLGTEIVNTVALTNGYSMTKTNTSTNTVLTLTSKINNYSASIPMSIKFKTSGTLTQTILISNVSVNQTSVIVQSESLGKLGFSRLRLPEEVTENMGNKIEYTIFTVARYVNNSTHTIKNYKNNLRVGVFNSNESYINNEKNFLNHVVWNSSIATKNFVLYQNKIVYDERYPLILVYSHDYTGDPIWDYLRYDFSEPIIVESKNAKVEDYKDFPKPIKALLADSDFATCVVDPNTSTSPVLLYEFDSGGIFELNNFICQGIQISGNYNCNNDIEIQFELESNGKTGFRNMMLKKGSGEFSVGNKYDLFGFIPHDLRENMGNMWLNLVLNNLYDSQTYVELNNITVTVTYFYAETGGYGFSVDGERSEEYGIYFTDFDYDIGTENELKMYSVPGTDDTLPYRMNITSKDITLEISVQDCDIKETSNMVDKVAKLFTNVRSKLTNKPEPKSIIFDIMPDRRFWWIRQQSIESDWETGNFDGKIKLIIPSGTAQSLTKTVTGSSGANNGIVAVTPIINARCTNTGDIYITERYRDQSVIIRNDGSIKIGDVITVDNEQPHKVTVRNGSTGEKDITYLVDYSTTWFSIHGEYMFEGNGCVVTSVEYYEEW